MTSTAAVELHRAPCERAAGARVGELFEAHGRMVYGLCRLLLRDEHEAEDAAQQAFLSAHRSLLTGTEPREPAAWLAAIARNECRARIRERMSRPLALADDLDHAAEDVEGTAGRRAEVEAICAAVAGLPQRQRDAIVLREFYGLSQDEIAVALGVSDSAVESLLVRGRRSLQDTLQPLRRASAAIGVPASLRESLAQALPGFSTTAGAGSGSLAAGAAAVLTKASAAPLAAKVAAVAVAVGAAVGTSGTTSSAVSELSDTAVRGRQVAAVVQAELGAAKTSLRGPSTKTGASASGPAADADSVPPPQGPPANDETDPVSETEVAPDEPAAEPVPAEEPTPAEEPVPAAEERPLEPEPLPPGDPLVANTAPAAPDEPLPRTAPEPASGR